MPVCLRHVQLVNKGNAAIGNGRVVIGDSAGNPVAGADGLYTQPSVAILNGSPDRLESCGAVALTSAEYMALPSVAAAAPFDYVYASGLWAFAFSTVVLLFFVSNSIGHVLGFLRRS